MPEEVHGLLKALVLFQFDRQAEKLQSAYDDALQTMEAALPEVWPEGLQTHQGPVSTVTSKTQLSFQADEGESSIASVVKCNRPTWLHSSLVQTRLRTASWRLSSSSRNLQPHNKVGGVGRVSRLVVDRFSFTCAQTNILLSPS